MHYAVTSGFRRLVRIALVIAAATSPLGAEGACNLIPVARLTFPSTKGSVATPITAPDETVQLAVDPTCDGSAGFESVPASNTVTVQFRPPGDGATTDVVIDSAGVSVADCTLPGGRCRRLSFPMPATDAVLPPHGLAGPAGIAVTDLSATMVAQIDELFVPTSGCDQFPERVFEHFTALPPAGNFAQLENGTQTEVLATVDGSGALLIPLDYWGGGVDTVLAETPGAPVAIFLEGSATIPALGAGDSETISEKLAAQASPSDFVRSFTLDGRPLPPLLRVTSAGGIFGTADAVQSVLRIASADGSGGPTLFDLSDRLTAGRGPIVIDTFVVGVNDPVPLKGLKSSDVTVAFTRDESREAVSLNADADFNDLVPYVVDATRGTSVGTGLAVTEVPNGSFAAPALATTGDVAAFLQSEAAENLASIEGTDIDLDGDVYDNLLRVFDRSGAEITPAAVGVATAPVLDGRALSATPTQVFARSPGEFVEVLFACPGPPGCVNGINSLSDTLVSPDGAHVYAVSSSDDAITLFDRDTATGQLSFVESVVDGVGGVDALDLAFAADVSPDGKHVYVASQFSNGFGDNAVSVFARDLVDGTLSVVQVLRDGVGGIDGIDRPLDVAVSGDGAYAYVIGGDDNAVAAFARNATTGALTFVEAEFQGVGGVDGLDRPTGVALSPDGTSLYVASEPLVLNVPDVAVFQRDPVTGALTYVEAVFDGVTTQAGGTLFQAQRLTVSPDSRHVYVSNFSIGGVSVFGRDPSDGSLVLVQAIRDGSGEGQLPTLANVGPIVVSPDGDCVYVPAGGADDALNIFRRNPATGILEAAGGIQTGVAGAIGVDSPFGLAVSPDGAHVYVGSQGANSLAVMNAHADLVALDVGSATIATTNLPASLVRASGERALLTTPEIVAGNLNGDGDPDDHVAQVYDTTTPTPTVTNLALAAWRLAISDSTLAVAVSEADQSDLPRNDDGDALDDVLAVGPASGTPAPSNVGIAVDLLEVTGTWVVFATPEPSEGAAGIGCGTTAPPGGCDLNGDGDASDLVLRAYDAVAGTVTEIGQAVVDFVVDGDLVAFRTREADQGEYLNPDPDMNDAVMQVYDLAADELINTELAALRCTLPGCDIGVPFKIKGNTVSFLTDEVEQGADLNGDTNVDDIVLSVFNVISRTVDFLDTVVDATSEPALELPIFPEDFLGETLALVEVREDEIGLDINADGMIDGTEVLLVEGDTDGDGAFDGVDDCVEYANPDQSDPDADGLGSRCEPADDVDTDGASNIDDNCPDISNPLQEDADGDGVGDVCDTAPLPPPTDIGVTGRKLVLVDKLTASGRAKIAYVAKDPSVSKGTTNDPSQISATFAYQLPTFGASGSAAMPGSANWLVNKPTVAKYVNKDAPVGGAVKVAAIKPAKVLKVVLKALGDAEMEIDIFKEGATDTTVDATTQYTVVNGGVGLRHCGEFTACARRLIAGGTGAKVVCKMAVPGASVVCP